MWAPLGWQGMQSCQLDGWTSGPIRCRGFITLPVLPCDGCADIHLLQRVVHPGRPLRGSMWLVCCNDVTPAVLQAYIVCLPAAKRAARLVQLDQLKPA